MATCELCLTDTELIRKSHIYPSFLYKGLFDHKQTIRRFTLDDILKGNLNVKKPRTGVYEGNLLCPKCENEVISKFESYAAKIFNHRDKDIKVNKIRTGELNTLYIEGINYAKFKNFFLSILYKANVSTFSEFEEISLGPYKDQVRNSVLNNSSLDDLDFQINILKFEKDSSFNEMIMQPLRSKIRAETNYVLLVRGFLIVVCVKENLASRKLKGIRLKKDGTILIPIIPKESERKFIGELLGLNTYHKK